MKVFVSIVLGLVVFVLLIVGTTELGYRLNQHYAPRQEQVRHDTFKQSQTYLDGMNNTLSDYHVQYDTGTQAQKDTIKAAILHEYASFDETKLTDENRTFLVQLRGY